VSIVPFAVFVLAGYAGLWLMRAGNKTLLAPLVIGILLLFIWLKKYAFLPSASFLSFPYLGLGLSYILFRVLHLIIDARNDALPDHVGFFTYLNYTLNLTTLVSGPIQRYQQFHKSYFGAPAWLTLREVGEAIERIIVGFFKVNVLGLLFSMVHNWGLQPNPGMTLATRCAMGIAAFGSYPLFLYCNFSGYIDIVIAIARLLHIELPENFNRPFSSDSFLTFWTRWHITLSEWLKFYVYNPLMMFFMRRYPSEAFEPYFGVGAFFVTFFLNGVWHGQTSVFVFFGVLNGLGTSLNKLYQILMARRMGRKGYKSLGQNPVYVAFSRGLTFSWVALTQVWFWSDWRQIAQLRAGYGWAALGLIWCAIFLTATVLLALWEAARAVLLGIEWLGTPVLLSRYSRTAWSTALLVVSVAIAALLSQRAPDIVYKAF
jgi:D-alanyl-lipoteichoic acid acyltransferase DltB (MBOAT superfamily)